MYSIVETGGFQYKVSMGDTVRIPLIDAEVGSEMEIKSVLLVANGADIKVGTPVVEDALVKAEILSHGKGEKVIVYKKKRRQGYDRKNGHRQGFTEILITGITSGSESSMLDAGFVSRVRARVAALAKQKEQGVRLTRKEKILKAAAQQQEQGEN
jgi:ribosomal protein L21